MNPTTKLAGRRIHNGLLIPENAVIHTNGQGRQFYVSGASMDEVTVRFIDNKQPEWQQISWGEAWAYKPFCIDMSDKAVSERRKAERVMQSKELKDKKQIKAEVKQEKLSL